MSIKESDIKYDSSNYGCEVRMKITHTPTSISVNGVSEGPREELKSRLEQELHLKLKGKV